MADGEQEANDGFIDERGIFISKGGMSRARARRLEAEARMTPEDRDALRSRYGLDRRSA
ncbi:hypothetical protein [Jidongwangia harbinensis]|uniref:hypothetical protein n=1 Tax=Jidongwangia harbinensis TaxID=2878561 RepID=UPI001CD9A626|nr:hypothetical protein [Jidongwangia harbinensis]MCA2214452.1 hypothetical protein [Jidongwangia harbinensis]